MGSWFDPDGLYRQYGTTKAIPEIGGDFLSYGETRTQEYSVDLTTLTGVTPLIVSNTTFVPKGVFIESVELDFEIAGATGVSLSVGLIGLDRATVDSATGFVNAFVVASMTQGNKVFLYGPPAAGGAGTYVGATTLTPVTGYLIVSSTATAFTTGKVKIRINYRTTTTITQ